MEALETFYNSLLITLKIYDSTIKHKQQEPQVLIIIKKCNIYCKNLTYLS